MSIIILLLTFFSVVFGNQLEVSLRRQVYTETGHNKWDTIEKTTRLNINETAIVIVDMWDKHWCTPETERNKYLSVLVNETITQARNIGIFIIHAPSECQDFYAGTKARQYTENLPFAKPPLDKFHSDNPLPINDTDGGCDDKNSHYAEVWTRENPLIYIDQNKDAILSDNLTESWNLFHARKVEKYYIHGSCRQYVCLAPFFCYSTSMEMGTPTTISKRYNR